MLVHFLDTLTDPSRKIALLGNLYALSREMLPVHKKISLRLAWLCR